MQFIDLQRQYIRLKKEIDESINNVLNKSNYIMGTEVLELEKQLAEYVGSKYCVTCGNGTDALILTLKAFNIKPGDAVFLPTFTFFATAEAIAICGAIPIFVDVDKRTFNISSGDLEKAIIEVLDSKKYKPKAIITVDLFGLPCDYRKIVEIANKYNLLIIEDAAQGFGGSINGEKACSFGNISTTSFFPAKPLGCYGDGGAIFTNDISKEELIKSLRTHGMGNDKYENIRIGMNSRLDTMQAAILIPKFKAFKEYELLARNNVAGLYNHYLNGLVDTPHIPEGYISSYAQYSILLKSEKQRNNIQQELKDYNIPSMIYYSKSLHQQSAFANNESIYRNFKNAEELSKTILNLPMHPYLDEETIIFICEIIKEAL